MANYCDNKLTLYHADAEKITEAINAYNDGRFFEQFIPQPPKLRSLDECRGDESTAALIAENRAATGYGFVTDFREKAWGSRWDIGQKEFGDCEIVDANTVNFRFDTAWKPPIAGYAKLEELDFEVKGLYYEPGNKLAGVYQWGSNDEHRDWNSAEDLPDGLDDAFEITAMEEESRGDWDRDN